MGSSVTTIRTMNTTPDALNDRVLLRVYGIYSSSLHVFLNILNFIVYYTYICGIGYIFRDVQQVISNIDKSNCQYFCHLSWQCAVLLCKIFLGHVIHYYAIDNGGYCFQPIYTHFTIIPAINNTRTSTSLTSKLESNSFEFLISIFDKRRKKHSKKSQTLSVKIEFLYFY